MSQDNFIKPLFLNLDGSYEEMSKEESPFIKGLGFDINANGDLATGTGNGSGEGQNELALTPSKSNVELPGVLLPSIGRNRNIGYFESDLTKELYVFNYNSAGQHGIYVLDGETMIFSKIIVDPKLNFSEDPIAFIADHRVTIRLIKNSIGEVVEKILMFTNGTNWQYWVLVRTGIQTDGFNASLYPYWSLQPPHFDRNELFEYATRKPMYAPVVTPIQNTDADRGKQNKLIDTGFEFCFQIVNTDGRDTEVSPFSVPYYVKTEAFLSNPDNIVKKLLLKLYAGSPLTEKINIYYRITKKEDSSNRFVTWGLWYLYDTIYKYKNSLTNTNAVLETDYWLRTDPWAAYNYDPVFNTISYIFDNSKLGQIVDQGLFSRIETALPQLSRAMSDIGDSVLMCNNRKGYDNFSEKITDKLSLTYVESDNNACPIPTRTVRMYAYIANAEEEACYISQVGYYNGVDTQMRFGGMRYDHDATEIIVNVDESKYFKLDFADREAFRLYFKGTPYFADGKWYQVNEDNTLVPLSELLDFSTTDAKILIQNIFKSKGYLVCVFEAEIPAGRYLATLGRHNVSSTQDYINTSTYIMGIANSRVKSVSGGISTSGLVYIGPNAIVSTSKEIEIDCTAGDVDVWGDNSDLFYVYCPHIARGTLGTYRFIEGYIKESPENKIGFELLPYNLQGVGGADDWGRFTDKNGFYFAYTKRANSDQRNITVTCKNNCIYPFSFNILSTSGYGYKDNPVAYYSTYNGNEVGFGNYVVYNARITDLTGNIGYSNIGISIQDGATAYTDGNGNARLIVHNGKDSARVSNVYVNAGSDFLISLDQCGYLSISTYNDALVPCQTDTERIYPIPRLVSVKISIGEEKSVKSNATYIGTIVGADLAGRQTAACRFGIKDVDSFLQRNNVSATMLKWVLNGALQLNQDIRTADIKWLGFFVSKATNYNRYLQWVGDKIEYIDNNGNVTTSPSNSVFVRITIDSLLDANIKQNFSLFANYQFVNGDRLRVFDDGAGHLYDTAVYGDMIDVDIQGTNYNQAAITANLLPPLTNAVLPQDQTVGSSPTTLYVKYDSKFDKLQNKTGFWIELYTPSQNQEIRPFGQAEGFYPVINGEIAVYTGGGVSAPQYIYPQSAVLNFWDTYLLRRSISILNAGNKFFNHPFESPNITDTWGANAISWGQQTIEDPSAKQLWYEDTTIRSDVFITNGAKNGLGTWRNENQKDFKGYQRGGITAVICEYSLIFFVCEVDWFVTDYNFNYIFANAQGVQIANLSDNMGEPHQKKGDNFGCSYKDTKTIFANDGIVGWHDARNSGYILSDYSQAVDITDIKDKGRRVGIKSYYSKKTQFINEWNDQHELKDIFDVTVGLDTQLNNLYITFRPRRNNTTALKSFVNERRNLQVENQETFVYGLDTQRWKRVELFTPESYGRITSFRMSNNMFSFANGKPYYHSPVVPSDFCNFYGLFVEPVLIGVINDNPENDKILMSIGEDINNTIFRIDLIYSNDNNGYSYVPLNYFEKKNTMFYAPVLRNMNTYPPLDKKEAFRSFLMDGKHVFGRYFIVRLVPDKNKIGVYFEINKLYYKLMPIGNNQK